MDTERVDVTRPIDPTAATAADVMQTRLVTLAPGEPLAVAERVLTDAGISGAPVVDAAGKLLGVVSLRDLVRHRSDDLDLPEGVAAVVFDDDVGETEVVRFARPDDGACVGDVMTQEVVAVSKATPLAAVAARMAEARVHRVLVEERGRLVGLVSALDALGAFATIV